MHYIRSGTAKVGRYQNCDKNNGTLDINFSRIIGTQIYCKFVKLTKISNILPFRRFNCDSEAYTKYLSSTAGFIYP